MNTERPTAERALPSRSRFGGGLLFVAICAAAVVIGTAGIAFAQNKGKTVGNGVVVIQTNLAYQGGAAAGTGMVLTSSGEILTNNHVIRGATRIRVVVPGTGRSYKATVAGYDVADDVAVLRASGASNLKTVSLGDSAHLSVGQSVTALGNAGGTGHLTSAPGRITGLGKSIVAGDEGTSERLTGLIETNANVQPGDSGGPLLTSAGRVIGMDTAVNSSSPFASSTTTQAYAIPIGKAITIVKRIESGQSSSRVHVGGTAFLGIEVQSDPYGSGAAIAQVVPGGPADRAGLAAGEVITAVAGHSVASPTALTNYLATRHPGDKVSVSYVDGYGSNRTATVTLGSGPAQ